MQHARTWINVFDPLLPDLRMICLRRFKMLSIVLLALSAMTAYAAEKRIIPIDSGWQFRQVLADPGAKSAEWRPAEVPGDVDLDLLHNDLIPQPFDRDNEVRLQWIQNASWDYQTTLNVTPEMLSHQHLELVFEGLDTVCDIYVNGERALSANNMFREWRVDIRSLLKPGVNRLLVEFPSPIKDASEVAATDPMQSLDHISDRSFVRRAAYEYGWDWGPTFVTSGIWRPVNLVIWDEARISDFYIHQLDVSSQVARMDLQLEVTASADDSAILVINYGYGSQKSSTTRKVFLHSGVNKIDLPVEIDSPALWYPAGYGKQPIYHFRARLATGNVTADEADAQTGLRTVVLRRDVDQWGRSFEFVVNGIPIFAKGANVIPFDSFPSRVTTAQYRRILQSAKDANMNIIRDWGGGYYETQQFYDMCDDLGLMVWQEFMFANAWQPGTSAVKDEVQKEVEYQVKRLRNHPSIVLWCGNNEIELFFGSPGWLSSPADTRLRLQQNYLALFSGVIPRTVARLDSETPYWRSSPSPDFEHLTADEHSGDIHDWTVWHGNADFNGYNQDNARFVSEYGFQSFPEMRTIEAFTRAEDRTSIFTPVMLAHQKNTAGNSIINDYMLRYYGRPKDFASFLYASQVLQAEAVKVGAEHFRRNRPRTMGSIFWQLNDCWPVASWSSIDYYGRWKALQYYARRFYAPVMVSPYVENGQLNVYVISDKTTPLKAQLRLRILDFHGRELQGLTQAVTIPALSSRVYIDLPLSQFVGVKGTDSAAVFGAADLTFDGKVLSDNVVYFAPTKLVQARLPPASVQSQLTGQGGTYTLKLSSSVLAPSTYVSFGDLDATFSDNYIDLLPGEPRVITITSNATADALRSSMKVVTLVDAFLQPTLNLPTVSGNKKK
jgi:beta-mannosidase